MFVFSLPIFIFVALPQLIGVAFYTLLERKVLGLVGIRTGPYKVCMLGVMQPVADALKLGNKSLNNLSSVSIFFYYISSSFMMVMSLASILCINIYPSPVLLKFTLLMFLVILAFNSFNSMLLGWSSYSKYSLLGSIRTVSQLISYEAVLFICIFFIVLCLNTFDLLSVIFFPLKLALFIFFPAFFAWVPMMLAELNRTPFDFSEGESELVSGFNTEFGSASFVLIFLSEYGMMIFFCVFTMMLFIAPIFTTFLFLNIYLIWIRSVIPRFRFDKLMMLAWKFFIPFLTGYYTYSLGFLS